MCSILSGSFLVDWIQCLLLDLSLPLERSCSSDTVHSVKLTLRLLLIADSGVTDQSESCFILYEKSGNSPTMSAELLLYS